VIALVIALAIVAAFFYALSDFLEQRAASRAASEQDEDTEQDGGRLARGLRSGLAAANRLIHDRIWFAGWAVGTLAYLIQALALHFGAVSVVQALQVTSLLFTLPLATYNRPERVRGREWLGGGAVVAGLALLFLVALRHQGAGHPDRGRMLFLLLLIAAAFVALIVVAFLKGGNTRAVLLAVAAGVAFASSASMVKLTTDDLATVGVPGTATDWPGYLVALTAIAGAVVQQAAFAAGKLPTAATAMILANPLVGTVFSFYAYGEHLPTGPLRLAGLAASGLIIIIGVYVLAHSPLLKGNDNDSAVEERSHGDERAERGEPARA
jgi:drug/metabolite transporter (DMT)-like permease